MARKTQSKAAAAAAAAQDSSPSSPELEPADLNLTEEEQAFLAREALGTLAPSDVPELPGRKLVDAIPETVFLSADQVRAAAREQEEQQGGDEIFRAAILVVPFTFCYLLMDILIHQQYGRTPGVKDELGRLATAIPVLAFLVFYSNRHGRRPLTQGLLFVLCVLAGSRLIWTLNKSGWLVVIRQAPPLSTLWILAITQLELGPAVGGLAAVYAFTWWKGLSVVL